MSEILDLQLGSWVITKRGVLAASGILHSRDGLVDWLSWAGKICVMLGCGCLGMWFISPCGLKQQNRDGTWSFVLCFP
jgi:hypothetical protein